MSIKNVKPYWKRNNLIAFDVSTRSTGWAIWQNGKMISGVIQPPKENTLLWERTRYIHHRVENLLFSDYCDWNVALEETIPKGYGMVAMLSEARSAVVTAIPSIITLADISPSTWKSYFGIKKMGSIQEKEAAHKWMCQIWKKDIPITMLGKEKTYDESDAIAVLTYTLYNKDYTEEL